MYSSDGVREGKARDTHCFVNVDDESTAGHERGTNRRGEYGYTLGKSGTDEREDDTRGPHDFVRVLRGMRLEDGC